MKFNLRKLSDRNFKEDIEISTLEDLTQYSKDIKEALIINEAYPWDDKNDYTVTILDGYFE